MNAFENWFCGSSFWRRIAQEKLLPWVVDGSDLGDRVLELGSGPGAITPALRRRAKSVVSLEYNHSSAATLHARDGAAGSLVVQGDAARLPFAAETFSSVIAVLMLHHLSGTMQQDATFAEARRVLRPGGVFLAFDLADKLIHRLLHFRSTFTPVDSQEVRSRFAASGFSFTSVDFANGGFRIRAERAG